MKRLRIWQHTEIYVMKVEACEIKKVSKFWVVGKSIFDFLLVRIYLLIRANFIHQFRVAMLTLNSYCPAHYLNLSRILMLIKKWGSEMWVFSLLVIFEGSYAFYKIPKSHQALEE